MSSGRTHLLTGIVLLAVAGYFVVPMVRGWKSLWRGQASVPAHRSESFDSTTGDAAIRGASAEKAYGPLAEAVDAQGSTGDSTSAVPAGSTPAPIPEPAAIDHIVAPDSDSPQRIVHKRFLLGDYHGFQFAIPAHVLGPKLHGKFRAFAPGGSSKIEVLLLSPQEFANFAADQSGTVTFSTDPANNGDVEWVLNAPIFDAEKYYLIFRSSSRRSAITVDADFTVSWK